MPNGIQIKEEITPNHLRCVPASCPAVYTLSDGNLLVIGKRLPDDLERQIQEKIADDELAVVLSPDYFQKLHSSS